MIAIPDNLDKQCGAVSAPRLWMTEEYLKLVYLAGFEAGLKASQEDQTLRDICYDSRKDEQ